MIKNFNVTNNILNLLKKENDLFNKGMNYGNNKSLVDFAYYSFFFLKDDELLVFFNNLSDDQKEKFYKDLDLNEFKNIPPATLFGNKSRTGVLNRKVNGSFVAVKRNSTTSELLKSYIGKDFDDCKFDEYLSDLNVNSDFFINPLLIKIFMNVAVVKDKELFYCNGNVFSFSSNSSSFINRHMNMPLAKFENTELSVWNYSKRKFNKKYMAFDSGCLINNQDITLTECKKINILDLIGLKHKGEELHFFKNVFNSILNEGVLPNGEDIVLVSDTGDVTLKSWVNSPSVEIRNKHLKSLLVSKLREEFTFNDNKFDEDLIFNSSSIDKNPIKVMSSGNFNLINKPTHKECVEKYFDTSTMSELISIIIDDEVFKNQYLSLLGISNENKNKSAIPCDENVLVLSLDFLKIVGERDICFDFDRATEYKKTIDSVVNVIKTVAEFDIFDRSLVVLKPEIDICFTDFAFKAHPLTISISGDIKKDDLTLFKGSLPSVCQYLWHHPDINNTSKEGDLVSSISSYFKREKSFLILNEESDKSFNEVKKIDFKL